MHKHFATPRTLAGALLIAAGALLPSAQAGITVTTLSPGSDGVLTSIRSGALDLPWSQMSTGHGVVAQARFVETRVSQLINANQALEYQNQVADSGWITTKQRGTLVFADASIDVTDIDPNNYVPPALAKVSMFGNHAHARTGSRLAMENTEDVTLNGKLYPAYSLYRTSGNSASARTAWYDTWQAHSNATVPLTLALDGNLSEDMSCVQQFCGQIIPPGINSVKTRSPQHDFWASFTVLDLDTLVDCNDPDKCGMAGLRPKAVAQLEARFVQEDEDSFPLMLDTTRLLTFEAIAGHRYLTIGLMEADSSNGGMVSFGNSLRLTGVGAPVGALTSSALGGDLASAFLSPVPEPHAAWLLLGGLAFMALRHTRVFNRGHEPMGA